MGADRHLGGRDEARRITLESIERYGAAKQPGEPAPGMGKAKGNHDAAA